MNAAVQEKISAEGTISELRQSLEQTHASNAALRDTLYRERATKGSQEDRHWANTAAFIEALQQERAKSAAQQQALEALRGEMAATVSLPVRSSGAVHGAPTPRMIGATVLRSQPQCLGHCVSSRPSDRTADVIDLLCAGRAGNGPGPAAQQPGRTACNQAAVRGHTGAAAGKPAEERAGAPPASALPKLSMANDRVSH